MADGAAQDATPAGAQPLNFGKRLAHTDKVVRDRGFKALHMLLKKNPELDRPDYMKLWKGLYFGMWMADKRPVQQELSVNIALLINNIPSEKQALWIDTFWLTMEEAWENLDKHRINKYMLFARIVVAEAFKALRLRSWPVEDVRSIARTFTRSTISASYGPNVHSLGLLLQFTRVFWEELEPQLEQKPQASADLLLELLLPFCALCERSHSDSLVKSIHENILQKAPPLVREGLAKHVMAVCDKKLAAFNLKAFRDTARALGVQPEGEDPKIKVHTKEPIDWFKKQKRNSKKKALKSSLNEEDAKDGKKRGLKKKSTKASGKTVKGSAPTRPAERSVPATKEAAAAAASLAHKKKRKRKADKEAGAQDKRPKTVVVKKKLKKSSKVGKKASKGGK